MQSESSIRAAAAGLDDALEAGDLERVVASFAPALGAVGRAVGPVAARFARRGLGPFEPIRRLE